LLALTTTINVLMAQNPNGNQHSLDFPEPESTAYLKVFPNPARNFITVEYNLDSEPANAQVLVIAADGRMIRHVHLKNSRDQVVIELQNLPSGMYIIQLKNNHKMLGTAKFNIL
jgi:hypothetical protein